MVKKLLITRPNHDVATSYLYDFSKEIVEIIRSTSDMHITCLEKSDVVRKEFEKVLTKENPKLIFLNGHGNRKEVFGHKDEIILDEDNISLTKKGIVYALSCDSLENLGPIGVNKGVRAYIGYKSSFMIVKDPSRVGTPNKDKNALPFKNACSVLIKSLIFGNTVSKCIEMTKTEYINSIRSYGTSDDDPYGDVPLIRFALAWNYKFLDFCGDGEATF